MWVSDGGAARRWYRDLLGREPDFRPFGDDTFCEWQFKPGYWEIHVVKRELAGSQTARFRFGVGDIDGARRTLVEKGIVVTEVEDLPQVVRWCNVDDPWGNALGLYQDLRCFP
jgi:catechol 2,3-dioxygenase-like lactoylglutathione lyase family enzyme